MTDQEAKREVVLRMLTFHGQLKDGETKRNKMVAEVWAEDLDGFTAKQINDAWKITRQTEKFFSLQAVMSNMNKEADKAIHLGSREQLSQALNFLQCGGRYKLEDPVTHHVMTRISPVAMFLGMGEEKAKATLVAGFPSDYVRTARDLRERMLLAPGKTEKQLLEMID